MFPANERTLTPESKFTLRQLAERERDSLIDVGLESSLRYDPSVPLARLLLGQHTNNPLQAQFLRDSDLARLPNDSSLWARASKSLLEQQQPKQAEEAAQKAISLDPDLPAAKEAMSEALEAQKK
jgi:tetratricopeptide (TPR) repeat protein